MNRVPIADRLVWAQVVRPQQPLVYLDMNHLIELARARVNHGHARPGYSELLDATRRAGREQRAVFPLSGQHLSEVSVVKNPRQRRDVADVDADTHLHVSFDVDFLDPDIAPGVGTTVRGGPTYREAQLCMELIADTGRVSSLDVMELNPACDVANRTAEVAVDLIESLFGKSTLLRLPGTPAG